MSGIRPPGRGVSSRKPPTRPNRGRTPPKRRVKIDFDSSTSDSDGSDIPFIGLQHFDSDEAEGNVIDIEGDKPIEVVEVVDWAPKTKVEPKKQHVTIKIKPPPDQIANLSSISHRSHEKRESTAIPKDENMICPDLPTNTDIKQQNPEIQPEISDSTPSNTPVVSPIQEIAIDTTKSYQSTTFQIFRDKTISSLGKFSLIELTMTQDSNIVYVAQEAEDKLNSMFIISTVRKDVVSVTNTPSIFEGYVRVHAMNKRFTVCSAGARLPLDDRDPELAGIAFMKKGIFEKQKHLRLVLPTSMKPHYPISKRKNLSRIASNGVDPDHDAHRFFFFDSSSDDHKTSDVHSCNSVKNCVIYDKEHRPIFRLFKSHDDMFTIKLDHPISPYVGFGIAIALIHSPTS